MIDQAQLTKEIIKAVGDAAPGRSDHAWIMFCALLVVVLVVISVGMVSLRVMRAVLDRMESDQAHREKISSMFAAAMTEAGRECHVQQEKMWDESREFQDEYRKEFAAVVAQNSQVIQQNSDELRNTREVVQSVERFLVESLRGEGS